MVLDRCLDIFSELINRYDIPPRAKNYDGTSRRLPALRNVTVVTLVRSTLNWYSFEVMPVTESYGKLATIRRHDFTKTKLVVGIYTDASMHSRLESDAMMAICFESTDSLF